MSQVENASNAGSSTVEAAEKETSANKMVAPTLRVEELKDDGHSSFSEEEGVLSHGEGGGSDQGSRDDIRKSPMPEFVPPEDELRDKIIKQVEFYFSDANILKDAFLLKHVRRNKLGFVSLKLITSFRKVKSLTKDFRVVAFSLKQSEELEINEDGTKVRRLAPLPEYDETTPSRTVVAVNLPFESPTIENVAELFKPCGEIALIRVLRPGKPIPPDIKKHLIKHPELGSVVCAVVEFEHHDSATKAVAKMTNTDDWRYGLRVVLLAGPKKKIEKKAKKVEGEEEKNGQQQNNSNNKEVQVENESSASNNWLKKNDRKKKRGSRVEELAQMEGESLSSGSDLDAGTETLACGEPIRRKSLPARGSLSPNPSEFNKLSPNTTPRSSPRNSPRSSPRGSPNMRKKMHGKSPLATDSLSPSGSPRPSPSASPEMRRKNSGANAGDLGASPSGSPWVQRRLKAQENSPLAAHSPGTSPRMGRKLLDQEGVLRQPKGPDGTKGFYGGMGRGKPLTVNAEA